VRKRSFRLTLKLPLPHSTGFGEPLPSPTGLKGVGFLQACLLAEPPSRAFLPPCERDARAPSPRCAGNAGVPPATPTAREKTYPSNTNRASEVHQLPPSFRFPPLREGNRARVRFPLLAGGTLRRGSSTAVFLNSGSAIGISSHRVGEGLGVRAENTNPLAYNEGVGCRSLARPCDYFSVMRRAPT